MIFPSPSSPKRMVDMLLKEGIIESREVEEALLAVKRCHFVPPHEKGGAYDLKAINLIPGSSSISQPQVVATMLEGLQLKKGQKVLEIGTASGYNAALLSQLVGDDQSIYTIERIGSLAHQARENLKVAGYPNVHVIHNDGCEGFLPESPYDRIIVTASSPLVPPALWRQLKERGRIVLPYDFYNLITLLVAIDKVSERGKGQIFGFPVLFVPLQGEGIWKEGDLKKYRRYIMREKEDDIVGLSLTLVSYYQNEGRVDQREVKKIFNKRGRPRGLEHRLYLLEDGQLRVKWEQE